MGVPLQLLAAATLAIWIYLLLGRGGFWREFARREGRALAPMGTAPRVVTVVPARDEAGVVARAIASRDKWPGTARTWNVYLDTKQWHAVYSEPE